MLPPRPVIVSRRQLLDVEHELTELLYIHALREWRGLDHVAEQHRELAALALRRGPLLGVERTATAAAEAGVAGGGRAAGRTDARQRRPAPLAEPTWAAFAAAAGARHARAHESDLPRGSRKSNHCSAVGAAASCERLTVGIMQAVSPGAETFRTSAEVYDRHVGRYASALASALIEFAGVEPGMRALDVGCGPGALAAALVERLGAASVCAADPSEPFARGVPRRGCPGSRSWRRPPRRCRSPTAPSTRRSRSWSSTS